MVLFIYICVYTVYVNTYNTFQHKKESINLRVKAWERFDIGEVGEAGEEVGKREAM